MRLPIDRSCSVQVERQCDFGKGPQSEHATGTLAFLLVGRLNSCNLRVRCSFSSNTTSSSTYSSSVVLQQQNRHIHTSKLNCTKEPKAFLRHPNFKMSNLVDKVKDKMDNKSGSSTGLSQGSKLPAVGALKEDNMEKGSIDLSLLKGKSESSYFTTTPSLPSHSPRCCLFG